VNEKRRRRATLGTCGGTHFLHDGLTDGLFVLIPLWTEAFGLSLTQAGLIKTAFSGALSVTQIPAGFLAERYGERIILTAGTICAGVGYMCLGLAGGFLGLVLAVIVVGIGCGTQHPLSSSLIAKAFDPGVRRTALGTFNFSGDLGKMAMPAILAAAAVVIGWRSGVVGTGLFVAVAGIAVFVALAVIGAGAAPAPSAKATPAEDPGWGIHHVRGFSTLSAISMFDSVARTGFLTFVPFLLIAKGAAVETVGFALALIFAGGAAGKFLCGILADRFGIIRTVVVTELATGAGILTLLFLPLGGILILLPLVGLALNGTSSVLYGTVTDFVTAERQSRAFGLFYTLGIGASAIAPAIFGVISDAAGVPTTLTIVAGMALIAVPLCPLLAGCLLPVTAKPV
jgi:MFS transporter, FSR family, fosmidomycin resistance protein